MAATEFTLITADGFELKGTNWQSKKNNSLLLWLHGFAEHRKRYDHFANWLNKKGINVAAIDMRGHGESKGKRGHILSFDDYLLDVQALLEWAQTEQKTSKSFLLGAHSNGSLIAARYLESRTSPIKLNAVVMTGPFFGIGVPVPGWKDTLAAKISHILPGLAVPTGIDSALLTHDTGICEAYASDPLVFNKATTRWYVETIKNQQLAIARSSEIKLPIQVQQGLGDKIVNPQSSRAFYDNIGTNKKKWIGYPELYHEILNELDREKVYRDLYAWLKKYK